MINKKILLFLTILFTIYIIPPATQADTQKRIRTSYDNIKVNNSNDIGLLCVHYDLKNILTTIPNLYVGIGGYGAITGDYGGFFTGGITAGYHKLLTTNLLPGKNWAIDTGFFAGGGGGAGAFPGGGLMLRSHLAIEKQFQASTLRLGIAQTNFPNSTNQYQKDTHITAGISFPINNNKPNNPKPNNSKLNIKHAISSEIASTILFYTPESSTIRDSTNPINSDITLLGFQYQKHKANNTYTIFELYGAGNGGIDGYAKVLAGVGYQLPVIDNLLEIDTKLLMGMAGGGGVDTGGGLIIQPMLGINIHLTQNWTLKPAAGYTYAPDGNFQAKTLQLSLSHNLAKTNKKTSSPKLSIAHKTYFPTSNAKTKSGADYADQIHQLGIILSRPVNKYLSISGSAFGAYKGGVGAYAEGLFGIEYKLSAINLTYNFGVAGGGGMDVGDGFIHQLTLGINKQITKQTNIKAEIGRTKPLEGSFEATTLQLSINKSF